MNLLPIQYTMPAMFFLLGQPAEPLSPAQMWVLIGLVIFGLLYAAIIRPMMRRKSDPLDTPPPSFSKSRSVERQMENLIVELSQMARQISAQLDTRAAKLEALIQEADQKMEALRKLNRDAPAPPPSGITPEPMPDPRHAEIYSLADNGQDANQIATQLDRPRGEVELILALRGNG